MNAPTSFAIVRKGALRDALVALYRAHPGWTSPEYAAALNCGPEYVRATLRRAGLPLAGARGPRRKPTP